MRLMISWILREWELELGFERELWVDGGRVILVGLLSTSRNVLADSTSWLSFMVVILDIVFSDKYSA